MKKILLGISMLSILGSIDNASSMEDTLHIDDRLSSRDLQLTQEPIDIEITQRVQGLITEKKYKW